MKHLLLTTIAAVLLVGCGNPDGALFQAVKGINIEAAKQAFADGADVNAKDQNGRTPLQIAALKGHKEVAELLIAKGADVDAKDEDGWTPLHRVAIWCHKEIEKEIIELLIAKSADVNAKDKYGDTPLDQVEYVDEEDHSPEDKAAKKETADFLRKHGGKTGEELEAAGN